MRHPEHEKFLEESWLFEAITETYLPLLQILEGWRRDGMDAPLTLSLSPPLCAMLLDPLLRSRYERHLDGLIELAEKEIHRTHWDRAFRELAWMYHHQFTSRSRETWRCLRAATSSARSDGFRTKAGWKSSPPPRRTGCCRCWPSHPPSLRAQILTARDHYRSCFGRDPRGIWLPECAYVAGIEKFLQEANIRWFILDTHGVLHAHPRPRYGTFAPIFTPNGMAAFGRDFDSSRQVWSKHEGYPGDARYRDFYRDIGFDLDFDYVKPHLPSPDNRGFTGMKYYRITGGAGEQGDLPSATWRCRPRRTRRHFLGRTHRAGPEKLAGILDRPPIVVAPYDAELFGHWWYEGPEFLDYFARKAFYDQKTIALITPGEYLHRHPTQPDRHARRVELGRGRLSARVAERKKRMDLSAPAGGAGTDDRAGAAV